MFFKLLMDAKVQESCHYLKMILA